jgi:hypothetical protein
MRERKIVRHSEGRFFPSEYNKGKKDSTVRHSEGRFFSS